MHLALRTRFLFYSIANKANTGFNNCKNSYLYNKIVKYLFGQRLAKKAPRKSRIYAGLILFYVVIMASDVKNRFVKKISMHKKL